MDIDIRIELPVLWQGTFEKRQWNSVNYIVGANGTGKSLFVEQLKQQLGQRGLKVRLLTAERLAGFEKTNYIYFTSSQLGEGLNISQFDHYKSYGNKYGLSSSAFILLKQRLDIRIRIEAILSDLFKKNIRLVEEGGYLKPKMQNVNGGTEYNLKEQECHGLKEIISLLTFLYDDEYNCLIFDEPELHLHPQFQSFILSEIQKIAGNPQVDPSKKLFFIVTHSPFFLDLQTLEDLKHILVCHNNQMPSYVKEGDLDEQDQYVLTRFLPRFNTHHKQFFFSPNPVFVEGYTDQQIISLLFEKVGLNISASGSSIIDVGGKDELAVFYRMCNKLGIHCRIIADYDALLRGKLRECFCNDDAVKAEFIRKGLGDNPSICIGQLGSLLVRIGDALSVATSMDSVLNRIIGHIKPLYADKANKLDAIKDCVLLSVQRYPDELKALLPTNRGDIDLAQSKLHHFTEAIKLSNIYITIKGELEHFFVSTAVDYLNITNKDKLFHNERNHILGMSNQDVATTYSELLTVLKESIPFINVNLLEHTRYTVIDFIQKVQTAVERGDVTNIETLRNNGNIDYVTYSQILECADGDFTVNADKQFHCKVTLKEPIVGRAIQVDFDNKTTAHGFQFNV